MLYFDDNGDLGLKINVNNFSNNSELFKTSNLFLFFKKVNAVTDPFLEEQNGEAYIADCPFKRDNHKKVLEYLKTKYKIKTLIDLEFINSSATTKINY